MEKSHAGFLAAYRELTPDTEPAERFLSTIEPEAVDAFDSHGLILIAPESFDNGVAGGILEFVTGDLGCKVVACSAPLTLDADNCNYMFVPSYNPSRFRFWLFTARFSLGQSVAVIMKGPLGKNVHDMLREAKGFRVPKLADPQSIRVRYGAITGVMNLVHTADNFAHVLRNCLPFFSPETLAGILNRAVRAREADLEAAARKASVIVNGLDRCVPRRRSFTRVFQRLILQLATCSLPQDGDADGQALLEATARFAALTPPASEVSFPVNAPDFLDLVVRCSGQTGLSELAAALLDIDRLHERDWLRLLTVARASGVDIDEVDALILMSALYYADQELVFESWG